MYLWLSHQQIKSILDHARTGAPEEVCGLIGGRDNRSVEIVPIDNIAPQPTTHFELDQQQQVETMLRWQREGLDLIGIYHSHPASLPIPSQTDIRNATYPDAATLIVSLKDAKGAFAAWHIKPPDVKRILLHVGDNPPDPADITPMRTPQRVAFLITVLVAVIFMIGYSIYLLPPAPPIPTPGG